jgi:hypothetical protein
MAKKPTDLELLQAAKDEQAKVVAKLQKKVDEKAAADAKVKAAQKAKAKKANEEYRAKRLNKQYAIKGMLAIVTQATKDMLKDAGDEREEALLRAVYDYKASKAPKEAVAKKVEVTSVKSKDIEVKEEEESSDGKA